MITTSVSPRQPSPSWQQQLAEAFVEPQALLRHLDLDPELGLRGSAFPMRVPRSYADRMRRGDRNDPLLLQVLPQRKELQEVAGFNVDPVGERSARRAPGLLQKYRGRALLLTTSACAVHCRYCFRREFPYQDHSDDAGRWHEALATFAADSSLSELILSGGDPWALGNSRLTALSESLQDIAQLRRLRIHTRLPIVLPARVDAGLLRWIATLPWRVTVVVHSNHPNEINACVTAALKSLAAHGATVLNQSVLLRGINDDASTLAALSDALFEAGVLPYYLHLLDPVAGSAHFDVPEATGRRLIAQLAAELPGYLVPRLVREQAGAPAKTLIAAGHAG